MSNIPKAREELKALALELHGSKRHRLQLIVAAYLHRASPTRRAPVTSAGVSKATVRKVKAYADANPTASMQRIASTYNINIGRVSEILSGKRA